MTVCSWRKKYLNLPILLLAFGCFSSVVRAGEQDARHPYQQVLYGAPFSATPDQLRALVDDVPEDKIVDGMFFVRLERGFVFDEQGRIKVRTHVICIPFTKDAVDELASISRRWAPWHEDRPQLRGRAVNKKGEESWIDQGTIVDSGDDESGNLYSDKRQVRVPFPNVTPGTVLEYEIVKTDHQPFFPLGVGLDLHLGGYYEKMANRVLIDVPKKAPANLKEYNLDGFTTRMEIEGGRVRRTYERVKTMAELGTVAEVEARHAEWGNIDSLPSDLFLEPQVHFSLAKSWRDLARAYEVWVDEQIGNETIDVDFSTLVKQEDVTATVYNLANWIHQRVRYTGLELGVNAIKPVSPRTCLERGFGDCKDKATLLVAMLRQAGYKAYVALLMSGDGQDVNPEVPCLNMFNHAIVYVDAKQPVWIDMTAENVADGYLPPGDQGRWALIASQKTKSLVKTPDYDSRQNYILETRDFTFNPTGPADVVETTVYQGSHDWRMRSQFVDAKETLDEEELNELYENYVRHAYRGGSITQRSFSPVQEGNKNFELKLSIAGVGRAMIEGDYAIAAVMPSALLGDLPAVLRQEGEPRKHPFVFEVPYVMEQVSRIHIPLGYVYVPTEEERTYSFDDSGSLRLRAELKDSQLLEVRALFDSGPKRISAETFNAYHDKVLALLEEDGVVFYFQNHGKKLVEEGKYREALALFRDNIRLEPDNEMHMIAFSNVLLKAGFGQEAIKVAKEAVARNPTSGHAYAGLGWALQHDAFGRRFFPGYDRQGGLDAYAKAIELLPENDVIRLDYAIALEHDAAGVWHSSKADLGQAIDQYRLIFEKEDLELKMAGNYRLALIYSRRWDDLKKTLDALEKPAQAVLNALMAMDQGDYEAGLQFIYRLSPDPNKRRKHLADVLAYHLKLGNFQLGARMIRDISRGIPGGAQLEIEAARLEKLAQIVETPARPLDSGKPEDFIIQFDQAFYHCFDYNFEPLKAYFSPELFEVGQDPAVDGNLFASVYQIHKLYKKMELPMDFLPKVLSAGLETKVESAGKTGYRVMQHASISDVPHKEFFFLVPKGKSFEIIGNQSYLYGLVRQAHQLIEMGKLKPARTWLEWYHRENKGPDVVGLKELLYPLDNLWGPLSSKKAGKTGLHGLVGCIQVREEKVDAQTVAYLQAALADQDDPETKDLIRLVLADAYRLLGETDQALALLDGVKPRFEQYFGFKLFLLKTYQKARLLSEFDTYVQALWEADPDREFWAYLLAENSVHRADFDKARKALLKLENGGDNPARTFNELAWNSLFDGTLNTESLEFAQKAVKVSQEKNGAVMHTLATVYAELGHCQEAVEALHKTLELSPSPGPRSQDWYVIGRIAEQYGLSEIALDAYRKVEKPENELQINDTYYLAQKRLEIMAEAQN